MMRAEEAIRARYEALSPVLDEQAGRHFVAAEALTVGYGGVSLVARITGVARSTINRGITELRVKRARGVFVKSAASGN